MLPRLLACGALLLPAAQREQAQTRRHRQLWACLVASPKVNHERPRDPGTPLLRICPKHGSRYLHPPVPNSALTIANMWEHSVLSEHDQKVYPYKERDVAKS